MRQVTSHQRNENGGAKGEDGKNSVIPAKAGIHDEEVKADAVMPRSWHYLMAV
jgi:hypothetical protein